MDNGHANGISNGYPNKCTNEYADEYANIHTNNNKFLASQVTTNMHACNTIPKAGKAFGPHDKRVTNHGRAVGINRHGAGAASAVRHRPRVARRE